MKNVLVVMLVIACLFGVAIAEEAKKADPRSTPETALTEAVRLLEAKDYVNMIKNFFPPEDLKQVLAQGSTMEQFALDFGKNGAPRMLNVLKGIKDVKPEVISDAKVLFKVPDGVDKEIRAVQFIKIEGLWYIANQ